MVLPNDLSKTFGLEEKDENTEKLLVKALQVHLSHVPISYFSNNCHRRTLSRQLRIDMSLFRCFKEEVLFPVWGEAIDREYQALLKRSTWKYVQHTPDMKPVPQLWVFKLKTLDKQAFNTCTKRTTTSAATCNKPTLISILPVYMRLWPDTKPFAYCSHSPQQKA